MALVNANKRASEANYCTKICLTAIKEGKIADLVRTAFKAGNRRLGRVSVPMSLICQGNY